MLTTVGLRAFISLHSAPHFINYSDYSIARLVATMTKEQATYSHGHHKSVVQDHARRTAKDSAAYLLPHLKASDYVLDVGCGPGTITADLAALVPEGKVVGSDAVETVLSQAEEYASSRGLTNVTFQQVDANALPFEDDTFDVVHCHQVLQHVKDPVAILKEMRRVCKPGGVVAAREADYRTFAWYPEPPELMKWMQLYQQVAKANGGEPNAGRYVHVWALDAGFTNDEITASWDTWRYSGVRATQFGESWSGRILQPGFLKTAVRENYATEDEIKTISEAWRTWGQHELAFIAIPHGEIICRKT
jgi:ubiquinone/menaquinone biosynthesis C-methylase UbiE